MTIRQALDTAKRQLETSGVDSPRQNARLLLADLLDTPYLQLLTAQDTPLEEDVLARFFALVSRRAAREPLQYILGHAHFMGHAFLTAPDVLIPRQDTEALCERALLHVQPGSRVLDHRQLVVALVGGVEVDGDDQVAVAGHHRHDGQRRNEHLQ